MRKSKTLIFLAIFLMNCSKTYIVPDNIIRDEITSRKLSQEVSISLISILTLPAAGILVQKVDPNLPGVSDLKWLAAVDKNGDTLEVEIKPVSTFIINTKNGEKIKMLASTAFIENGKIKGKRSLLVGMPREVRIEDIKSIRLYTEGSKTRKH